MGYTTDFTGRFDLNKVLDAETLALLKGLNETRRMKRNIDGYGIEGEFYFKDEVTGVVDHNRPPRSQPGLWCGWMPTSDAKGIEWDGGEKFYEYVEWLQYLVDKVLAPNGYKLTGVVAWRGENSDDLGAIYVKNNKIEALRGEVVYKRPKALKGKRI